MKLLFLISFLVSTASLANDKEIIDYFYTSLPPYEFIDSNQQAAGIGIQKITSLFQNSSYNLEFRYNSYTRGLSLLHNGEYEYVAAISPSDNIKKNFFISEEPIYFVSVGIIRRKDSVQLNNLSQLRNLPFVTLTDTSFQFLDKTLSSNKDNDRRYEVTTFDEAMTLINSKRFTYFLTYDYPNKLNTLNTLEFNELKRVPVHIAISKQHPKANELLALINNLLVHTQ